MSFGMQFFLLKHFLYDFSVKNTTCGWTINEIHAIDRLSSIVLTENTRVSDSESRVLVIIIVLHLIRRTYRVSAFRIFLKN